MHDAAEKDDECAEHPAEQIDRAWRAGRPSMSGRRLAELGAGETHFALGQRVWRCTPPSSTTIEKLGSTSDSRGQASALISALVMIARAAAVPHSPRAWGARCQPLIASPRRRHQSRWPPGCRYRGNRALAVQSTTTPASRWASVKTSCTHHHVVDARLALFACLEADSVPTATLLGRICVAHISADHALSMDLQDCCIKLSNPSLAIHHSRPTPPIALHVFCLLAWTQKLAASISRLVLVRSSHLPECR